MADKKDPQESTSHASQDEAEQKVNEKIREILAKSKKTTSWSFNNYQLSDPDLELIANELKMDQTCERLDLQRCNLYPDDAHHLAEMLKVNTTLKELWLSFNHIGDEGFRSICETLKEGRNKTVKTLDLTSNGIKGTCVDTIEEMINTNQTLTHLYVWGNPIPQETRDRLKNAAEQRIPELYFY